MSDDRNTGGMPPPPPGSSGSNAPGGASGGRSQPPPSSPPPQSSQPPQSAQAPGSWNQPSAPAGQPGGGWGSDQPTGPQPAGLGLRIGAYVIDYIGLFIIIAIITLILAIPFAISEGSSAMPFAGGGSFLFQFITGLIGAAIILAYFGLMEANDGQTIGKKLLSVRAVKANGSSLELGDAIKRRVPFIIGSLIPIPFLGGLVGFAIAIAILVTAAQDNPFNRGLHDKWADTMVVRS